MKLNLSSKLIFVSLLAFTVSTFVYFSFGNIYSSKILNAAEFKAQFNSGIYQYRILSGGLLLWVYDLLSILIIDYQIFKFKFIQRESEPAMYLAFYVLNTFFLVLSSLVMILITETENFAASYSEKTMLVAIAIFSIALSQFVIVPYDVSSYFFQVLFFFFILIYLKKPTLKTLFLPIVIVAVATLNRESAALSLALAATFLYSRFGFNKKMLMPLALLTATFLAVYLGMRLASQSFSTNDGNLLLQNFTQPKNLLGLLFWAVFMIFSLMLARDNYAVKMILLFHLFALPYLLMSFYSGILYEIRLYVPIFLTSIFLGRTEIPRLSIN